MLAAALLALLAGCGGDTGGSVNPPPPKAAAGVIDRSFGQDGVASVAGSSIETPYSSGFVSAQDASGRIWTAGQLAASADLAATPSVTLVARFLPNGFDDIRLQGTGFLQGPRVSAASAWGTAIAFSGDGASIVEFERDACGATCPPLAAFVARHVLVDGGFDPAFGNAGVAPIDIFVTDTLPDANGALLAFGRQARGTLAKAAIRRIDASGRPDPTYAANAANALDCGGTPQASASAVKAARLPGGKVLAAYVVMDVPSTLDNVCVVRLNTDGTLDTTYGNQGRLQVVSGSFDFSSPVAVLASADGSAAIPLQVTVPVPPSNNPCVSGMSASLFWATSDGRQDASRTSSIPALIDLAAAAIQSDGRILLAGYAPGSGCEAPDFANPVLERLGAEGTLDIAFGAAATGRVTLAPTGRALAPNHVLFGSDGGIYVTGAWRTAGSAAASQLAVVKLGS